jgi:hypothetical protein
MFGSEFIERLEGRNQFVFDSNAEACTEEEFITFLVTFGNMHFDLKIESV